MNDVYISRVEKRASHDLFFPFERGRCYIEERICEKRVRRFSQKEMLRCGCDYLALEIL